MIIKHGIDHQGRGGRKEFREQSRICSPETLCALRSWRFNFFLVSEKVNAVTLPKLWLTEIIGAMYHTKE
jgi:hypothetical protein